MVALILRTVSIGPDRNADAARFRFLEKSQAGVAIAALVVLVVGEMAIEKARIQFDRHPASGAGIDQLVFILIEFGVFGPIAEFRRDVKMPDDVPGKFLDRFEQRRHVELPDFLGSDVSIELLELGVVERPLITGAQLGMLDRQEVHRANHRVRAHRVDDVLRVGTAARVVVDLSADRVAHATTQPFGDDGGVTDLDAGRLGGAVEIAGVREFEGTAHEIDGGRIFEGEVVHVVGDHHEARGTTHASVIKPEEKHPRGVWDRALLGVRLVLAFGVTVDVGNRVDAGIALAVGVQRASISVSMPRR